MSAVSRRPAVLFAALLALAALSGCADVRQNPASNVVNGQADASTQQNAAPQHAAPTNVPF
jgi:uncharacterized protein YceK